MSRIPNNSHVLFRYKCYFDSKWTKNAPRLPPMLPTWCQHGLKWSQMLPKWSPNGLSGPQMHSKSSPNGLNMVSRSVLGAFQGSNLILGSILGGVGAPFWLPKGPQKSSKINFFSTLIASQSSKSFFLLFASILDRCPKLFLRSFWY